MRKEQKIESIALAKKIFSENEMCIMLNYKNLSASDVDVLRNALKDKNANVRVLKNTLVKKAIENTDYKNLSEFLTEQVAISYCKDPLVLASVITNYIKNNDKLQIKAGLMNGKYIDLNTIEQLSKLGSMDDVRARFIGVLRAPGSKLARVFDAYAKKEQ